MKKQMISMASAALILTMSTPAFSAVIPFGGLPISIAKQVGTARAPHIADGYNIILKRNDNVQLPSPFTKHATIEDLQTAVGIDFKVPDAPEGYTICLIRDISRGLAEITFSRGADTISYRVATGSEDKSGVYTDYEHTKQVTVNGTQVTCKGNGDAFNLAVWAKDGHSGSIYAGSGLTCDQMQAMIASIL